MCGTARSKNHGFAASHEPSANGFGSLGLRQRKFDADSINSAVGGCGQRSQVAKRSTAAGENSASPCLSETEPSGICVLAEKPTKFITFPHGRLSVILCLLFETSRLT